MKLKPTAHHIIQNGKKPHFYEQQHSLTSLQVPKYQKVLAPALRGKQSQTGYSEQNGSEPTQKKYVIK
jgi:hypothetical protein